MQREPAIPKQIGDVHHVRTQQRLAAGEHDRARAVVAQPVGERADLAPCQVVGAVGAPPVARHAARVAAGGWREQHHRQRMGLRGPLPELDQQIRADVSGREQPGNPSISAYARRRATLGSAVGPCHIGPSVGRAHTVDESSADPRLFPGRRRDGATDHEAVCSAGDPVPGGLPGTAWHRCRGVRHDVCVARRAGAAPAGRAPGTSSASTRI